MIWDFPTYPNKGFRNYFSLAPAEEASRKQSGKVEVEMDGNKGDQWRLVRIRWPARNANPQGKSHTEMGGQRGAWKMTENRDGAEKGSQGSGGTRVNEHLGFRGSEDRLLIFIGRRRRDQMKVQSA